ncbi:MAG: hypothetical protein MOB07_00100 [Acidobacteria bacterium]|nr:hypothetical protein [Acidobacteriota bacterium]
MIRLSNIDRAVKACEAIPRIAGEGWIFSMSCNGKKGKRRDNGKGRGLTSIPPEQPVFMPTLCSGRRPGEHRTRVVGYNTIDWLTAIKALL